MHAPHRDGLQELICAAYVLAYVLGDAEAPLDARIPLATSYGNPKHWGTPTARPAEDSVVDDGARTPLVQFHDPVSMEDVCTHLHNHFLEKSAAFKIPPPPPCLIWGAGAVSGGHRQ